MKYALVKTLTGTDRARYDVDNTRDLERLLELADSLPYPADDEFDRDDYPHTPNGWPPIDLSEDFSISVSRDRINIIREVKL